MILSLESRTSLLKTAFKIWAPPESTSEIHGSAYCHTFQPCCNFFMLLSELGRSNTYTSSYTGVSLKTIAALIKLSTSEHQVSTPAIVASQGSEGVPMRGGMEMPGGGPGGRSTGADSCAGVPSCASAGSGISVGAGPCAGVSPCSAGGGGCGG